MAKTNIPAFDTVAANNTDLNNISTAVGWPAPNIGSSVRNMMALLKQYLANSVTVASASTIDFGAQTGNYLVITGTTAITALGTVAAGTWKDVKFTGTPLLTYNATSLILPGSANIQTVAGDTCRFVSEASGNWRCTQYLRSTGLPPVAVLTPAISEIGGLLPTSIAGTSTTATITITAGSAADSTNVRRLTLGSQAWAVANGNAINGYDGGSTLPNSSTIHFFICYGTTGTGTFASTSLTPTFPTGYTTYNRRIFSLTTTAAGALIGGVATELAGGACQLDFAATLTVLSGAAPTLSAISFALPTPLGVKVQGNVRITSTNPNNGGLGTLFTSLDQPDEAPGAIAGNQSFGSGNTTLGISQSGERSVMTDTSAQIRRRSNNTTGTLSLACYGYTDARRT